MATMHKANLDLCVSFTSQSIPTDQKRSGATGKSTSDAAFISAKVGKSELIASIPQNMDKGRSLCVHNVTFNSAREDFFFIFKSFYYSLDIPAVIE